MAATLSAAVGANGTRRSDGQSVARSGGHDPERDAAMDQRGGGLVDGAVAAPGNHEVHTGVRRLPGEAMRIATGFGGEDRGGHAERGEDLCGQRRWRRI